MQYHGTMTTSTAHTANEAEESANDALASAPATTERLWTPLFIFIIAMTLCSFVVGQGLNSGTSVYLARSGDTATFAGILAFVFSIAAAITRIVSGPVIDRSGRFRVMLGGMLLLLAGTAIPACVSGTGVFVACRVLQGIGFSAATTASATAAADVLPLSRLGEGIGYYGLGQALAMSIGPAFALFLVSTDPAENLYLGLAAVAAIGIVMTCFCRYETKPDRLPATATYRERLAEKAQNRAAIDIADAAANTAEATIDTADAATSTAKTTRKSGVLGQFFVASALPGTLPMLILSPAFGFGIFFVGLYGTSLDIGNAGLFYTVSAVSMIAVRLKSKAFMDRVAPIKISTASTLCGLAAFGMLLAAPYSELLYYASGLLYGVCLGVSLPLNQSVAVKNTPPERWGAANALYLLASDIGIGFSSAIWGFVNDMGGFSVTICCVMACIVASYVVAWISYPKERAGHAEG